MEKIGEILLDTGVLLLGDLMVLKKIKQTPHSEHRRFVHRETQQVYVHGVDFQKYTDVLLAGKTVNQLLAESILTAEKQTNNTELSSENILQDLESGIKQLFFETGTPGKALAILSEEGSYPVYAETDENGIARLIIDFRAEQEGPP